VTDKSFEDRLRDLAAGTVSRAAKEESLALRRQQEEDEFRQRFEKLLTSTVKPVLDRACAALRQGGCTDVQTTIAGNRDRASLTLASDGRFYALAVIPALAARSVRVFTGAGPTSDEVQILATVLAGTGRASDSWSLEEISETQLEARVLRFATEAFK
jgi:hypothetical protein